MRPGPRARTGLLLAAFALFVVFGSNAVANPPGFAPAKGYSKHVCGQVSGPHARCNAEIVTDASGTPLSSPLVAVGGLWPSQLQDAYKATAAAANNGVGQTVAIVDAYDAPNAERDLAVYRNNFGIPGCSSDTTLAHPCSGIFRKVNQTGGSTPPTANGGWAQEISLDIDMVSAICPNCQILLVEANSNSYTDLGIATQYAIANAGQVSNSYGGGESAGPSYYQYYNGTSKGVAVTASTGDNGYGVEFPSSAPGVTAVGGTSLKTAATTRGWSETAWSGAGSGCSSYFTRPIFQTTTMTSCSNRAVADISAEADPNTGVAVYDSYSYQGAAGWMVFGGTSVASPIVASVNAITGGGSAGLAYWGTAYSSTADLFDVTSGSNGSCTTSKWCRAGTGWDGPTGLGTPNVLAYNGGGGGANPPQNTNVPSIDGTAVESNTLSTDGGTWNNPGTATYQWLRCSSTSCSAISGTTGASYRLTSADVGKKVEVQVTQTNGDGAAQATSAQSATVVALLTASPTTASIVRGQSQTFLVSEDPGASPGVSGALTISGQGSGWNRTTGALSGPGSTANATISTTTSSSTGTRTLTITAPDGSRVTVSLTVRKR